MRFVHRLVAIALLAAAALPAASQTLLFDFDDVTPGIYSTNFTYQGYIFSPRFNFYLVAPNTDINPQPTTWLGMTNSSSLGPVNPQYLGPANGPLIYLVRQDGASFTLEGLTSVGIVAGVISSNGGSFTFPQNAALSFSGPAWTAVQWLGFGAGSGGLKGFDNLVLSAVPEPAAGWLFALGLMGVALNRYRAASTT